MTDKLIIPKYSRIKTQVTRAGQLQVQNFTFARDKGLIAVHGKPTEKDALAVVDWLDAVGQSAQVMLGTLLDWMDKNGQRLWGKTVYEVAEKSEVAEQTIYNSFSVMHRIPEENRLPGLSFSDYSAIAHFQPDEQREWIDKKFKGTDGEPWSARELHARIHPEHDQYHEVVCQACGAINLVDRAVTVLGLKDTETKIIEQTNEGD